MQGSGEDIAFKHIQTLSVPDVTMFVAKENINTLIYAHSYFPRIVTLRWLGDSYGDMKSFYLRPGQHKCKGTFLVKNHRGCDAYIFYVVKSVLSKALVDINQKNNYILQFEDIFIFKSPVIDYQELDENTHLMVLTKNNEIHTINHFTGQRLYKYTGMTQMQANVILVPCCDIDNLSLIITEHH